MSSIASLMVRELVTASPMESVTAVANRMASNRVGAVLLLDEGDRLVGVLTERDLLNRVLARKCDPDSTGVGEIQTENPTSIDIKQSLKDALAIFRERRFRHLPVTADGKPVGILSTTDLHEYLVEGFERLIDDLKYRNLLNQGVDPYDHFGGQYGK